MTNEKLNILTVVDIGSSKTVALAAEVTDQGLHYAGHGVCDTRGVRKGIIADLDKAITTVQTAVQQAEDLVGAPIERAIVGVAGPHIRGVNSQGGITIGARPRDISRDDVRQAVDKARNIGIPPDRQMLHLLPQEFILDGQDGIHEPAQMVGSRLEVRVHVVTSASAPTQNVVTALNRAGILVDDT